MASKQALLTEYIEISYDEVEPLIDSEKKHVVSIFGDITHLDLVNYANAGYNCTSYIDPSQSDATFSGSNHGIEVVKQQITLSFLEEICIKHAGQVAFACASPPAKLLSLAGARSWKKKKESDPNFQKRFITLISTIRAMFETWGCPYYIIFPFASTLKTMYRQPTFVFEPCHFGHYLATGTHPLFPSIVPSYDAYLHKHGLWTGGRFRLPHPLPVQPKFRLVITKKKGKRVLKQVSPILTRRAAVARVSTPRGFARAVFLRLLGITAGSEEDLTQVWAEVADEEDLEAAVESEESEGSEASVDSQDDDSDSGSDDSA